MTTDRWRALRLIAERVLGRNNLTGTDFTEIEVRTVEGRFESGDSGLLVQFTVNQRELNKVATQDLYDALDALTVEAEETGAPVSCASRRRETGTGCCDRHEASRHDVTDRVQGVSKRGR